MTIQQSKHAVGACYQLRQTTPCTHAVAVGERVRLGLMGAARQLCGPDAIPSLLSGRSPHGGRLSGHEHGYFLPLDLDGDGKLDHVSVVARNGLPDDARAVLEDFRWFVYRGLRQHVTLTHLGPLDGLPVGEAATLWRSVTPFVLPRHPKLRAGQPRLDSEGRWIEGPEWQLEQELQRVGLPRPIEVRPTAGLRLGERSLPWSAFQRARRHGGGRHGPRWGHGFEVRFAEPVLGPIAVGYSAHFGLGQLHPTLA